MAVANFAPAIEAGTTAIDLRPISTPAAQQIYGIQGWRQWTHGGPVFNWTFESPLAVYVIDGVALARPVGRWTFCRYQVLQPGDIANMPPGFDSVWTIHPSLTIAWRKGRLTLTLRRALGPRGR